MKLSIITINFNNRDGLRKTIESVVNQNYQEFEYIIIDGGSTDDSVEVIKEFAEHIDYWVSEPDKGIYNAMNKGIERVHGEYCIFMNSGDCFHSNDVIEKFVTNINNEDIACGDTYLGETKKAFAEITFETLFNSSICHQSAFIKTKLMKKYMYDESLKIVADRKFFLQAFITENCTYKPLHFIVANYDITGFSAQNRTLSELEYKKVLEEIIPYRIRVDYGKKREGLLYGDDFYSKLFFEIKKRRYKKIIYLICTIFLYCISIFRKSAKFIRNYPIKV